MVGFALGWVGLSSLLGVAHAGPFTHKTSQGEWVSNPVERPLVMPKGWLEVGAAFETKTSTEYRGTDGVRRSQPAGVRWRYSQTWLELRQGFSDRVTLYGRAPIVSARLDLAGGSHISTTDVGDARLGLVAQPWEVGPHSLGFSLELKTPTGVEWPEGSGGADDTSGFLTGTGTTDLSGRLHGRYSVAERLLLGANLGYVHKFAAVVGYVQEVGGFGNGIIDPGDVVELTASIQALVVDGVSVTAGADYRLMGQAEVGVTGDGGDGLQPVLPSGGRWFDVSTKVTVEPTPHLSAEVWLSRDLAGGDTRPFAHLGLEDFAPQPGWTYGLRGVTRW